MRKNYITLLALSFSFFISTASLSYPQNVKHDVAGLVDTLPDGRQVFNPARALGAHSLHGRGINGRGVNVAFIDVFDPTYMKPLMDQGSIHPDALRDKTFISPGEHLSVWKNALLALRNQRQGSLRNSSTMERSEFGSFMLQHFNKVAPGAKIVPLDFETLREEGVPEGAIPPNLSLALTLRKAFTYQVDAIFVGDFCPENEGGDGYGYTADDFNALREAKQRGIALIYNGAPGLTNNPLVGSPVKKIFEELEGNGILFTGALDYDEGGREKKGFLTSVVESPLRERLIFAPHCHNHPFENKLTKTPEMASSYCMSAFALLKQHAKDKALSHSTEALLQILRNSGHDLTDFNTTYKVLDLPNALEFAEGRTGGSPYVAKDPNPRPVYFPPSTHEGGAGASAAVPSLRTRGGSRSRAAAPGRQRPAASQRKARTSAAPGRQRPAASQRKARTSAAPGRQRPAASQRKARTSAAPGRQRPAVSQGKARSTQRGSARTRRLSTTKRTAATPRTTGRSSLPRTRTKVARVR